MCTPPLVGSFQVQSQPHASSGSQGMVELRGVDVGCITELLALVLAWESSNYPLLPSVFCSGFPSL
ncbi:hypothetical protein BR93DRAFT_921658 [Coniochaeta sp. PMI_546]|nr:hypothetical protein BR93DRAFT_921658 [Coniochaeta sp. PMI_546]